MSSVFIIQNDLGQFLTKQGEWTTTDDADHVFKSSHKDLAVNQLFETTSKDMGIRAKVVEAAADTRGVPILADLPPLAWPRFELPQDMQSATSGPTADESADVQAQEPQAELPIESTETDPI